MNFRCIVAHSFMHILLILTFPFFITICNNIVNTNKYSIYYSYICVYVCVREHPRCWPRFWNYQNANWIALTFSFHLVWTLTLTDSAFFTAKTGEWLMIYSQTASKRLKLTRWKVVDFSFCICYILKVVNLPKWNALYWPFSICAELVNVSTRQVIQWLTALIRGIENFMRFSR